MAETGTNHGGHGKMLRYRAWHRGTREMDLLLGPFADAHVDAFTHAEFEVFEALLELPDPKLNDLIMHGGAIPDPLQNVLLQKLRAFHGLAA